MMCPYFLELFYFIQRGIPLKDSFPRIMEQHNEHQIPSRLDTQWQRGSWMRFHNWLAF